jgi:hypothetical protein
VVFSTLNDRIPLPAAHATPVFELPSEAEITALFAGYEVLQLETSLLKDSHWPLVAEHSHGVTRVLARRTAQVTG